MVERALCKRTVVGSIPTGGCVFGALLRIIVLGLRCLELRKGKMETPGFEPGTLRMQSGCDTTTPHSHI